MGLYPGKKSLCSGRTGRPEKQRKEKDFQQKEIFFQK
jgi:hypothetical protein